jgi:hypothetical protein
MRKSMDGMKTLEVECSQMNKDKMVIWAQLSDNKEQQDIIQKILATKEKEHKFKYVIGTLSPAEVATMNNEKKNCIWK